MRREELFRLIPDENAAMIYFQNKNLIYNALIVMYVTIIWNDIMETKFFDALKEAVTRKYLCSQIAYSKILNYLWEKYCLLFMNGLWIHLYQK